MLVEREDNAKSGCRLEKITLFGLPLINADIEAVLLEIRNIQHAVFIAFMNAHCFNVLVGDREYNDALESADYLLPDGIGVELAARLRGKKLKANLNGTDFIPAFLGTMQAEKPSVFFLGAKPGIAERAAARLQQEFPKLLVSGCWDGYGVAGTDAEAIEAINSSGADILLVAKGVPSQEIWISQHRGILRPKFIFGVGAFFDFWAGEVMRAPSWLRRFRLEWLWRLAMEPRRMAYRYLVGNFVFMYRAVCDALQGRSYDLER